MMMDLIMRHAVMVELVAPLCIIKFMPLIAGYIVIFYIVYTLLFSVFDDAQYEFLYVKAKKKKKKSFKIFQ